MTLQPPPDIPAAFQSALSRFLTGPSDQAKIIERFAGVVPLLPALEEIGPLTGPTVLGLADAAANSGLGAAVMAGWRFYAGSGKIGW